jgi:hypothetical protein
VVATLSAAGTPAALVEATAVACAFGLAAVFVAAAGFKLLDGATTIAEFDGLGLPRSGLLARLVPAVEVLTAALLLVRPRLGSMASVVLLAVFTAVLARALHQGKSATCGCFGAVGAAPISSATLVRNGVLMVMAVAAAAQTSLTLPDMAAVITVSMVALIVAVTTQLLVLGRRLGHVWSVELAGESNSTEVSL